MAHHRRSIHLHNKNHQKREQIRPHLAHGASLQPRRAGESNEWQRSKACGYLLAAQTPALTSSPIENGAGARYCKSLKLPQQGQGVSTLTSAKGNVATRAAAAELTMIG